MTSGHEGRAKQRGRKEERSPAARGARRRRRPLAAHRGFVPLTGLWGALLGGLCVMVLPSAVLADTFEGTMIGALVAAAGGAGQMLAAAIAALLLGATLALSAAFLHARASETAGTISVAERAVREVTPINPVRDLGSRRLDDPFEAEPFTTPAWRETDPEAAAAVPEPEAEPVPEPTAAAAPCELDLAAFAALPGRNAVWVEESVALSEPALESEPVPEPAPAPAPVAVPAPGTAALARLRAVPPGELSLPQMVERFAGALHEHRAAPPTRALGGTELAAREAALAEALKSLAALSAQGRPAGQPLASQESLRAALARLQPQAERSRGAA